MLCVIWYNYVRTREMLLADAYQSTEQEAERIQKNFSTMMEPYETVLDVLYVDQMLSGYLFADYSRNSYEDMFYYIDNKISEICLMNGSIHKICFYTNNQTLPQDNYYFYDMKTIERKNQVVIAEAGGETVLCGMTGQDSVLSLNRLMNFYPQGGLKSVLTLEIENDLVQGLLEPLTETDEIYLIDRKGKILASSVTETIGSSITTGIPQKSLESRTQFEFERDDIAKIGNMQNGKFDTRILVVSDKETVLKGAKSVLRRMVLLIFCSAGLVLVCIIWYTKWMTERVQRVVYAAKRLGQGEFDYRLERMGEDEIGQIGAAFNQLERSDSETNPGKL